MSFKQHLPGSLSNYEHPSASEALRLIEECEG